MYKHSPSNLARPRAQRSIRAGLGLAAALTALVALLAGLGNASADSEPEFRFPWQDGVAWQTGESGFHGTNDAIDFFPPDTPLGGTFSCVWDPGWTLQESDYWILASADGTVTEIGQAYVLLDHGNGWFSRYYHLAEPQVATGDHVVPGMRLGHPSTLGECTTGPHVHFWVQGPNGETTASVSLSGRTTTSLSIGEWISETGNFDTAHDPTPTPTVTPEPSPSPADAPTPSPTPTPVAGDADCDGQVTPLDAMFILRFAADLQTMSCTALTADVNCDSQVTVADASLVLQAAASGKQVTLTCAPTATPSAPPTPAPTPTPTPTPHPTMPRTSPTKITE